MHPYAKKLAKTTRRPELIGCVRCSASALPLCSIDDDFVITSGPHAVPKKRITKPITSRRAPGFTALDFANPNPDVTLWAAKLPAPKDAEAGTASDGAGPESGDGITTDAASGAALPGDGIVIGEGIVTALDGAVKRSGDRTASSFDASDGLRAMLSRAGQHQHLA